MGSFRARRRCCCCVLLLLLLLLLLGSSWGILVRHHAVVVPPPTARRRWMPPRAPLVHGRPFAPSRNHRPMPLSLLWAKKEQSSHGQQGDRAEQETPLDPPLSLLTVATAKSNSNDNNNTSTTTTTTTISSILLLNLVAILWGTQHSIIKQVVSDTNNPAAFTLLRFALAAALASPYTPSLLRLRPQPQQQSLEEEEKTKNNSEWIATTSTTPSSSTSTILGKEGGDAAATTWRWGLEMGFWMFLGFAFQAIGLEYTTAQRSGFLLYINVKLVPFLAYILYRRPIRAATWVSALTAFTGTALLALGGDSDRGSSTATTWDFNVGDAWTIAAAAASAMFILRLERASTRVADAAALNAACLWMVALCATVWTVTVHQDSNPSLLGAVLSLEDGTIVASTTTTTTAPSLVTELVNIATTHPFALIYLGGITTALCNWLQTKAQRDISAERASIIYAMDPVYGAAFAYLWLGETLNTAASWWGAGLITVAAATNALWDVTSSSSSSQRTSSSSTAVTEKDGDQQSSSASREEWLNANVARTVIRDEKNLKEVDTGG